MIILLSHPHHLLKGCELVGFLLLVSGLDWLGLVVLGAVVHRGDALVRVDLLLRGR